MTLLPKRYFRTHRLHIAGRLLLARRFRLTCRLRLSARRCWAGIRFRPGLFARGLCVAALCRARVLGAAQAAFETATPAQKVSVCAALGLTGRLAECP